MAMPEAVERGPSTQIRGSRRALVRLDGQMVGTFVETERGTRFTYDPAWLQRPDAVPISLALPLAPEPYDWPGLHPVFENLLPEGWLLGIATTKLRIAPDDGFGLMLATCADCVGAVEILPMPGETAP
jgi:HipA-like protein